MKAKPETISAAFARIRAKKEADGAVASASTAATTDAKPRIGLKSSPALTKKKKVLPKYEEKFESDSEHDFTLHDSSDEDSARKGKGKKAAQAEDSASDEDQDDDEEEVLPKRTTARRKVFNSDGSDSDEDVKPVAKAKTAPPKAKAVVPAPKAAAPKAPAVRNVISLDSEDASDAAMSGDESQSFRI